MTISDTEQVALENLAEKKVFSLFLINMFFTPIAGYAYTGRYTQLISSCIIMICAVKFFGIAEAETDFGAVVDCLFGFLGMLFLSLAITKQSFTREKTHIIAVAILTIIRVNLAIISENMLIKRRKISKSNY